MTFRQWVETSDICDLPDVVYRYAEAAWQAAQDELIKSAWKEYGEDFADCLMEIVGRKVKPDWEEESDDV